MTRRLLARERLVFVAASAVLVAHTLLDTVVAPDRGTGWDDHLSAAGVPVAVLAAVLVIRGRLRPGGRAALAAALGALSLVGAGLAVADARQTFARASDWTGFLLAPVGVTLLALAAALAWGSRRSGRLRHVRRAVAAAAALLCAYWLVVPVALALVATHRPRAAAGGAADLGSAYRQVRLRTSDGLTLAAWYVPSRNGAAVISLPTRQGRLEHARMLVRHGYGVLLLDMRGFDGSAGRPNSFGWGSAEDVDAAVAWLAKQPDVHAGRIGGIGFSVGGEQLLEAAAGDHRLRAVVADGAGERSVRETWLRGLRAGLALPEAAVQTAAVSVLSQALPPPSLRDVAARIAPGAVLFVYAGRGGGGEDLNPVYYRAARQPKEIWKIAEAGHTDGLRVRPADYERRVVGFFDRYLLRARAMPG